MGGAAGIGLDETCKAIFDKIPTALVRFSAPANFFEQLVQKIEPAVTIDAAKEPIAKLIAELPGFYATVSVMTDITFERDAKATEVLDVLDQRAGSFGYEYRTDFWTAKARDRFDQVIQEHLVGRNAAYRETRGRREALVDCRAGERWCWYVWRKAPLGDP